MNTSLELLHSDLVIPSTSDFIEQVLPQDTETEILGGIFVVPTGTVLRTPILGCNRARWVPPTGTLPETQGYWMFLVQINDPSQEGMAWVRQDEMGKWRILAALQDEPVIEPELGAGL